MGLRLSVFVLERAWSNYGFTLDFKGFTAYDDRVRDTLLHNSQFGRFVVMPRRPKPWYWAARECWYVQINKKQVRLDPDEDVAWREYGRMLAAGGALNEREISRLTVPEAIDLFLDKAAHPTIQETTRKTLLRNLSLFAKAMVGRSLASLTYDDVVNYCVSPPDWKEGYRHSAYSKIKGFTQWARNRGYIALDPLAGQGNPFAESIREVMMSEQQLGKLASVCSPSFNLLLRAIYYSGCRPGEACKMLVKNLHPTEPIVDLGTRHKTGRKTGRKRIIIFPSGIADEIRLSIRGKSPDDFIFTTPTGRPWRDHSVSDHMRRARTKAGLPDDLVPYAARHAFATQLIHAGENTALAAKAMGHKGDQMIQSQYLHAQHEAIQQMVERRASPKKTTKQEMKDEIKALSARLAELTAKVLEGDG
jgi:integrase